MPHLPVLNNPPDLESANIAADLAEAIGDGADIRFSRHDRLLYSTDASLYQVEPLGVIIPHSTNDAARAVAACSARNLPILPRGGGTSLAGQCTNRAVVIDLTPNCRAIKHIDTTARTAHVEPGLSIDELNDHLTRIKSGLFFAPDPATTRQCAIGGAIGNNAAGARSIIYGRTSENLERIEVALAMPLRAANKVSGASSRSDDLNPSLRSGLVDSGSSERLWLGPNAGSTSPTARHLAQGVIDIVRRNADLIRARFPKTIRRNAGYGLDMVLAQLDQGATAETLDLSKLLCGSEGTLAVTLSAILKLHPTPKAKALALIAFDSVDEAIEAVQPILKTNPSAVELLDDVVLDAARGNAECREYLKIMPSAAGSEPGAILYVEYFAFSEGGPPLRGGSFPAADELLSKFIALRNAIPDQVTSMRTCTDAPSMAKAWALRKAGEPLLHGLPGPRKPITFVEDNAVPVERLAEFVREFRKIVTRHGTRAAYWAHASVGVLHVRPMIDIHDEADRQRLRAIAVEVADLARACGGIMSGEHGDGRVRGPLLERFFGPELMQAFREVKHLFDPNGLLNPGNIVAPGPIENITTNLRVDGGSAPSAPSPALAGEVSERGSASKDEGGTHAPNVSTFFSYSDSEGFPHAIEQCNGAGVCRKRGGVMCPSFQALLDERHSTRGRGNALRLAITGQFPPRGMGLPAHVSGASPESLGSVRSAEPNWSDPDTIETLDLCLSCKACKSECPSNVDIARLKAEYTAQRYKQTGHIPLASLATGHVRILNQLGAFAPNLANAVSNSSPARAFINRVMHMHPNRSLPPFSKSLYRSSPSRHSALGTPHLLLFTDCFTTYNESHIGIAAINVLRKLGYQVSLSGSHCCARSMISVGMLETAIETIDAAVESLRSAIEDDNVKAIIVCEPSCLSAIKDDWLTLNCRTPLALRQQLANKAMLPEDFIDRFWDTHPTPPSLPKSAIQNPQSEILFHAHCHQKSLWGADSSVRLLKRLTGPRLRVLDTGCCGMAGSFGFSAHRYDLSMKIGELALLPIVRTAPPDAIIVATGTSCRHQIHDGAHRRAIHPIELAAQLLA